MYSASSFDIKSTIVLLQILMNVACVVSVQSTRKEGCVGKMNSKSIMAWHADYVYNIAVIAVWGHAYMVCTWVFSLLRRYLYS